MRHHVPERRGAAAQQTRGPGRRGTAVRARILRVEVVVLGSVRGVQVRHEPSRGRARGHVRPAYHRDHRLVRRPHVPDARVVRVHARRRRVDRGRDLRGVLGRAARDGLVVHDLRRARPLRRAQRARVRVRAERDGRVHLDRDIRASVRRDGARVRGVRVGRRDRGTARASASRSAPAPGAGASEGTGTCDRPDDWTPRVLGIVRVRGVHGTAVRAAARADAAGAGRHPRAC